MEYRPLGSTGLRVSALAFGAGPVPALMTGGDAESQLATVRRAIEARINWFDTAAGYGDGASERSLGNALRKLAVGDRVHIASKVRLTDQDLSSVRRAVTESVARSLERLGVPAVTLLQLHNAVTARRGEEPTSVTPADVLGPGGVLEAFESLRAKGLVRHLGLTGIGQPDALREVVRSGRFHTMQIPYNVLNPSAGRPVPPTLKETNYGNLIADCAGRGMGVMAIRVFAGGALAGNAPSGHTLKTPFFPLDLYRRDQQRAERLARVLAGRVGLKEAAVRFALSHPLVSSAIVGFGEPDHVDEAVAFAAAGPLPPELLHRLGSLHLDSGDNRAAAGGGT